MQANTKETAIDLVRVAKRFGDVVALDEVSLTIQDNELFTLLGPSGCGKTTLLRLIAGFEGLSGGQIALFGEDISSLPASERPVNTVFQHYALFPHMTVAQNVGFGMQMLKRDRTHITTRTQAMLELVQMSHLADRLPTQLSGGQQQRVALARALAPEPRVLLLDEPLSALDLKLRQAMRLELKQIQKDTGITFVFVTHDQEEALAMSDRIAVMSDGRVQQVGTPHDIYDAPVNRFVADFIGDTNFLSAQVTGVEDGHAQCRIDDQTMILADTVSDVRAGQDGTLSIRPERLRPADPGETVHFEAKLIQKVYIGTDTQWQMQLENGQPLTLRMQNRQHLTQDTSEGAVIPLVCEAGAARFLVN